MSENRFGFGFDPHKLISFGSVDGRMDAYKVNNFVARLGNINQRLAYKILVKEHGVFYLPDDVHANRVFVDHLGSRFMYCGFGVVPPVFEPPFFSRKTTINETPVVYMAFYWCKLDGLSDTGERRSVPTRFSTGSNSDTFTILLPVYENRGIYGRDAACQVGWKSAFRRVTGLNVIERCVSNSLDAYQNECVKNGFSGEPVAFGRYNVNLYQLLNTDRRGTFKSQNVVPQNCAANASSVKRMQSFKQKDKSNHAKYIFTHDEVYQWRNNNMAVVDNVVLPNTFSPFRENETTTYLHVDDSMFISADLASKLSLHTGLVRPLKDVDSNLASSVAVTRSRCGVKHMARRLNETRKYDERFRNRSTYHNEVSNFNKNTRFAEAAESSRTEVRESSRVETSGGVEVRESSRIEFSGEAPP